MVAGDGQQWGRQRLEEIGRRLEFRDAGTLRDIARNHHQVRRRHDHRAQQSRQDRRVDTAEMQVRKMDDRARQIPPRRRQSAAGTTTRNAPGRLR